MRMRIGRLGGSVALWAIAAMTVIPLYFLLVTALRPGPDYSRDPSGLPGKLTLSNVDALLSNEGVLRWVANSALLTGASTVIVLVLAIMAAHALTYVGLPGAGILLKAIASLMVLPPILLVVPLFVQFARLDLIDSYVGAILIYSGLALPFAIYMLSQFFKGIPRGILDAARTDGATPLTILPTVVVPLAKPAIATLGVVTAFFVWNDLLIALVFLQSDDHRPLMAGLTTLAGRQTQDIPVVMSGVLLSVLPIIALYLASQRFLGRAIYAGSLRGE